MLSNQRLMLRAGELGRGGVLQVSWQDLTRYLPQNLFSSVTVVVCGCFCIHTGHGLQGLK